MIAFTIETEIARPPAEVFDYVTDPARLASWQTNTVSAVVEGGGPVQLGARIREVHRAPGGRELESVVEVCEYEPGRVFGMRIVEGSLPIDGRITLAPVPGGAAMRFALSGRPAGPMRLAAPILRLILRRQFAGDCARLKRVLESAGGR